MPRTLIIGWPKTGKTTLAEKLGGGRSTDEAMHLGWSEASAEVATWLDDPNYGIIEGVAIPRALRKWHDKYPGQPPPVDKIIYLRKVRQEIPAGAISMGKGMDKVLAEIGPWLSQVPSEEVVE